MVKYLPSRPGILDHFQEILAIYIKNTPRYEFSVKWSAEISFQSNNWNDYIVLLAQLNYRFSTLWGISPLLMPYPKYSSAFGPALLYGKGL